MEGLLARALISLFKGYAVSVGSTFRNKLRENISLTENDNVTIQKPAFLVVAQKKLKVIWEL